MKKILIIEDNEDVRENIEEILDLYGYDTETAVNGTDGVRKALANPPDIILCDIMMPELDGYGTLKILSQKTTTADIPFVFLTAKSEKEDFRRGMNLGADDYITKPFYKDDLLQVIEMRLKKSERLQQALPANNQKFNTFINEARAIKVLNELSEEHTLQTFRKKDIMIEEGTTPRYLYLVQSGKVKLYKTNEYGKELIVNTCNEGEFFGYTSLIKGEPLGFSAAAMEKTKVSLIPESDFMQLLHADRDVASRFIKMLADNVFEKEEQLLQLAYTSIRKRTADALLHLAEREGALQFSILREDLAQMVGTAKESVIRMLTEFRHAKYIDIKGGDIIILNKGKLENMPG